MNLNPENGEVFYDYFIKSITQARPCNIWKLDVGWVVVAG